MASILQQIDILQARFSSRKNVKFCSHYIEATATQSATIAPCCQCARTVLRSSVIACATRNGISGVIEYFTKSFTWGCYPCKYYCECFRHSDELFCTATMCIGLEALNIYRQHVKASVSFDLATVELIIIQPKDVINSSKIDIADSRSAHPNKSISSEWLLEDTMYHNLVGIVDRNMQLTACDFDSEFILNDSGINCQARIAAIRVCPWTGGDTSRSFLSSTNTPAAVGKTVAWSGLTIPLGRWFNIPAANFDRDDALKASLGSVYSNLALQPEPHLVDSCGPAMVNAGTFASSHISTDSLNSQCTLEVTLSELPLSTLRPFATLPAKILPTVLISGIHMGTNPCPGVGVARALRATYQDSVRLLALDDAQFSDPVFDALHQVFEMGSTLCSATASSQRQWDTVASLLLEHLRGDRRKEQAAVISQKPSFYMPCRDRDIDVAAQGKSALARFIQYKLNTCSGSADAGVDDSSSSCTNAAVQSFLQLFAAADDDNTCCLRDRDVKVSVDALLERGGGGVGCLKASPPATLAELHALSDALLCPDAAVVELTAKPDIRAATRGPLGKYFRVPEYARLSGNATTTTITAKTADLMQESEKSSDTYCVINYSSSDTSLATKVSSGATGPSPAPAFRGTTSLMEIRAFAERIGYPVLLKGPQQGAAMCHSWLQLRHLITTAKWAQNGGFIQRRTTGWEKCLAFAAYEGKLSGCVMMTKASYTDSGKVWSGDMEPVPPELFAALQEFTELTRWTGGGEIEFIEELVPSGEGITFGNCKCNSNINNSVDADNNLPTRWVVDFNPRFPAWIFASTYSGCNLPTLLLQDALRARLNKEQIQQETTLIHVCSAMSLSAISEVPNCEGFSGTANSPSGTCSTSSDACQAPSTTRATTSGVNGAVRTSFVRSVIEVPVVHALHQRSLPSLAAGMAPTKLRTGMAPTGDRESRYDVLPQSICELLLGDECFSDTLTGDLTTIAQDLHRLTSAVQELLSRENVERTPQYVLNVPTLEHTLERLQRAIETSRDVAIRNTSNISNIGGSPSLLPPPGLTRATPPERELMHVQMCLSVKTQPNTLLLRAAERAGYMAECIDMAEVYHSVQDGGFPWGRIVLTGPGKWWDCKSPVERAAELQENQEKQQEQNYDSHLNGRKLHAIFADSLADLKMIVQRLLDPADWLEAEEVGIRWVPLWGPASRFGLNCKDVKVVRQAAEVVAQLPLSYRLGMHFHHACSALGAEQWFALAKGFSVFCREFGTLCGRPVTTLDFGGGFEPYFLESAYSQSQLTALFECVYHTCVRPPSGDGAVHSTTPICVQFELGKSVSEQAGGVLTRILSIREREDLLGGRKKGSDEGKNDSIGEDDDDEATEESASCNAVIMGTTVADISTPNSHAVFWIQRTVAVPAAPNAHQEGTCASTSAVAATALARGATRTTAYSTYKCIPLSAGRTELWGRTCMEWDKIPGGFELPAEAQVGDLLLISGCGAYDMSMQYDFGDGEGRSKNVIVL